MSGDRAEAAIRWSTVAVVTGVAVGAGWASYEHAYAVVAAHGEHGMVARIYPGTIDGLIYAASMVLLDSARRRIPPPAIAWWLLAAGIAATLAANIVAGIAYGWLGAIVAAWPAPALVGSYELLMWLVRTGAAQAGMMPGQAAAAQVARDAEHAARIALAASVAAGNPVSQRALMERFGLTRTAAARVRQEVTGTANGQGQLEGGP